MSQVRRRRPSRGSSARVSWSARTTSVSVAGCNVGAEGVTTPFVLFINPDCRVDPGCVGQLERALQEHAEAALAGGAVKNVDGSEQRGSRRALPDPRRIALTVTGLERLSRWFPPLAGVNLPPPPPDGTTPVGAVSGAMMLVRTDVFRQIGGFDPGYFLHVEDLDLCARIRDAGHQVLYVPSAHAVHDKGVSQRARPLWASRHKHASLLRYLGKFHSTTMAGAGGAVLRLLVWIHYAVTAPIVWMRR